MIRIRVSLFISVVSVATVAGAQELPTVPLPGEVLQVASAPPTLARLTDAYLRGDWVEFTADATKLVESAATACAPVEVTVNPSCRQERARFDLANDYVQLLWMATLPTATEPTILSAIIHTPNVEPYSRVVPGLSRRSGHRLFELFVTDDAPPEVASYYVSKPVPDPLLSEAPAVVDKFLGPLFTYFNKVNPPEVTFLSVDTARKPRYFVVRQVNLPEPRATVEVSITARVPLAIETMDGRIATLKRELSGKGLLTTSDLEAQFDRIGVAMTTAAKTCEAVNEVTCRARLHKAVVEEAASLRLNVATEEEKAALAALEKTVREFVDGLKPASASAKYSLDNSPLRHLSFGLLTSVALDVYGNDQRAKVDGGKVVADPLPRALNMVVMNFSAGYQAKTSQRIVRGWPAIRGFTGVVFSPDIGISVGASWAILHNLGVNFGYAHLFITRPENGLEIGAVLDEKIEDADGNPTSEFRYSDDLRRDPLQRGRLGALFLGVSYNFK